MTSATSAGQLSCCGGTWRRRPSSLAPPGQTWQIQSRAWLTRTLGALGAFAEGRRYGEEALRLATLEGRGQEPIVAHGCLGLLYLAQGDLEHAVRVLDQGLALCRASGNWLWLQVIAAWLGYAAALQGRLAEGRALLEEAISESLRTGVLTGQARRARMAQRGLPSGGRRRGGPAARPPGARPGPAAEGACRRGARAAPAWRCLCPRRPPDVEQAAAHYQQALALAEALGMRPLVAHCHLGLGRLYGQTGQREQARVALSAAIDLYRAMDMPLWLPQAEAALVQVA